MGCEMPTYLQAALVFLAVISTITVLIMAVIAVRLTLEETGWWWRWQKRRQSNRGRNDG